MVLSVRLAQICSSSLVLVALCSFLCVNASDDDTPSSPPSPSLQRWQQCDVFLAPSGWMNGGFGVFANKSYKQDEIIEISPIFLPFEFDSNHIVHSALRDYMYGYRRAGAPLGVIVPGNTMFLNHHPEAPNVAFANFGNEPSDRNPDSSQAVGFAAKRDIEKGEELFTTYWEEDGGAQWFKSRGLPLMEIPKEGLKMNQTDLTDMSQRFCSKIYAGIGAPTWNDRIMPTCPTEHVSYTFETDRLAPFDAGLHGVVTKVDVKPGDILDTAPALILLKRHVDGSALAPLVFFWDDLQPEHQSMLRQFRSMGGLFVQHQSQENDWQRQDRFEGFHQVVVFAGGLAPLPRVGDGDEANCRIEILPSGMEDGNARLVLQLVATKEIAAGDALKLNLPPSNATDEEKSLLRKEFLKTGQPLSTLDFGEQKTSSDPDDEF